MDGDTVHSDLLRRSIGSPCTPDTIDISMSVLFMWHKDQKAVSHCLTAVLQMAQTQKDVSSQARLAEWT